MHMHNINRHRAVHNIATSWYYSDDNTLKKRELNSFAHICTLETHVCIFTGFVCMLYSDRAWFCHMTTLVCDKMYTVTSHTVWISQQNKKKIIYYKNVWIHHRTAQHIFTYYIFTLYASTLHALHIFTFRFFFLLEFIRYWRQFGLSVGESPVMNNHLQLFDIYFFGIMKLRFPRQYGNKFMNECGWYVHAINFRNKFPLQFYFSFTYTVVQ